MIKRDRDGRGAILAVRARAGAKSNGIRGVHADELKVDVTQVAEKGQANRAIVGLLSDNLGWPKSQIELVSGATSRQKRFLFRDASTALLLAAIERALRG